MYERMLDKQHTPTIEEIMTYCGKTSSLLKEVNDYLINEFHTQTELRFPYGNNYGWSIAHRKSKKLICDIFVEKDSFSVMMRLSNGQCDAVYQDVLPYTKEYLNNKYPCSNGGWIHYRVLSKEHLLDIKKLLQIKMK